MQAKTQEYIGEEAVDIWDTPYKDYYPRDWALEYIMNYGQIDGGHHKQWVLDQVARILSGTPVIVTKATWKNPDLTEFRYETGEPSKEYLQWVKESKGEYDEEEEEYEYSYDEGIAP